MSENSSLSKFSFERYPVDIEKIAQAVNNKSYDILPEGFTRVDTLASLFSLSEQNNSAIDLYHPESDSKIFVFKSEPEELHNTNMLLENGIDGILPLMGEIRVGENIFVFGNVPAACVNVQSFSSDTDNAKSFGLEGVITRAADTLSKIHSTGYAHGSFVISHIVLNPDPDNPIYLYHHGKMRDSSDEKSQDIQMFFDSMQEIHTPEKIDSLKTTFMNQYNKSLWRK
ncbi:MAG TPA: hypothetical protein PLD54_03115 [Candidatus Levybacteria bacterium]|nr:hypothetical protein [Candidatus Levybacteria bacterium]